MSYDLWGAWETTLGHNAPLFSGSEEDKILNVAWCAQHWKDLGAPVEKMIAGLATYGRSFTSDNEKFGEKCIPTSNGCQPGKAQTYTNIPGVFSYFEACLMLKKGAMRYWDDVRKVPYLYDSATRFWGAYDDAESLAYKVNWILRKGFRGVMVWTLDFDDFNGICDEGKYPLMRSINAAISEAEPGPQITPAPTGELIPPQFPQRITTLSPNVKVKITNDEAVQRKKSGDDNVICEGIGHITNIWCSNNCFSASSFCPEDLCQCYALGSAQLTPAPAAQNTPAPSQITTLLTPGNAVPPTTAPPKVYIPNDEAIRRKKQDKDDNVFCEKNKNVQTAATDDWCSMVCFWDPPHCPENDCRCYVSVNSSNDVAESVKRAPGSGETPAVAPAYTHASTAAQTDLPRTTNYKSKMDISNNEAYDRKKLGENVNCVDKNKKDGNENGNYDKWCYDNCFAGFGNCPKKFCRCYVEGNFKAAPSAAARAATTPKSTTAKFTNKLTVFNEEARQRKDKGENVVCKGAIDDVYNKWCEKNCFIEAKVCPVSKCQCYIETPRISRRGPEAEKRTSYDVKLPKNLKGEVTVLKRALHKLLVEIRELLELLSPAEYHAPSMRSRRQISNALLEKLRDLEKTLTETMEKASSELNAPDVELDVARLIKDLKKTKSAVGSLEEDYLDNVADQDSRIIKKFGDVKTSLTEVLAKVEKVDTDMKSFSAKFARAVPDEPADYGPVAEALSGAAVGVALNVCCLLFLRWLHTGSGKLENWTDKFIQPSMPLDYVSNLACIILPYVGLPVVLAANMSRRKKYSENSPKNVHVEAPKENPSVSQANLNVTQEGQNTV